MKTDLLFALFKSLRVGQRVRVNSKVRLSESQRNRIGRWCVVVDFDRTPGRLVMGHCPILLKWDDGVSYFLPRFTISTR